jgi:hypothetical protein
MLGGYCRGQPRGSPKKPGKSCLKPANNKTKHTSNLSTYTRHGPRCGGPRGPPEWPNQAPPRARSASLEGSRPLEQGPPRSRTHAPSSGFRLARGIPHGCTCSSTRVQAFNALTQQSRAITRLGNTPRRCSANSLGGADPRHCGGLCDEAGVSSVTLCRLL